MDGFRERESHMMNGYKPLKESDEIRLLRLHPRTPDWVLKCTIEHAKLSETPKYEALSYMWGEEANRGSKNLHTVQIEGTSLRVKENLRAALRQLAPRENTSRLMWIDAVCINQEDDREKGHQVELMGRIYSQASKVIVWLGEADSTSSLAVSVISISSVSDYSSAAEKLKKLSAVLKLCRREYWTRLWIIQEVLLAADIILCCGSESFSWDSLSRLISSLRGHQLLHQTPTTAFAPQRRDVESIIQKIQDSAPARLALERQDRQNRMLEKEESRLLLEICSEFGEAKCKDRRDKIFGFHSLAADCCREAVPVNYSRPWPEISAMLLCHMLQHRNVKLKRPNMTTFQKLHQKLPIELGRLAHSSVEFSSPNVIITGYLRGRLVHASETLGSLQEPTRSRPTLPSISDSINRQMKYIDSIRGDYHHQHMTTQIALVASARIGTASVAWGPENPFLSRYPGEATPTGKATPFFKWRRHLSRTDESIANYRRILHDATQLGGDAPDSRLALEENGLVMFVPGGTEVGDIVCQFLYSNILVILRRDAEVPGKYRIVGRAVDFLATAPDAMSGICGHHAAGSVWRLHKVMRLRFTVDIHTLHLISKASRRPEELSRIPRRRGAQLFDDQDDEYAHRFKNEEAMDDYEEWKTHT
jgi:hypothetical protein